MKKYFLAVIILTMTTLPLSVSAVQSKSIIHQRNQKKEKITDHFSSFKKIHLAVKSSLGNKVFKVSSKSKKAPNQKKVIKNLRKSYIIAGILSALFFLAFYIVLQVMGSAILGFTFIGLSILSSFACILLYIIWLVYSLS